jgi:hypothetical protein
MATQGKYEPQEIPKWIQGDMQEAEDRVLEIIQIWLDMTPEQQRRLIEFAREMSQGEVP